MIEFHLIRHAKTSWNLEKRIQGRTDVPLCPEGVSQADAWADALQQQAYDRVLTSPMRRAVETARIIAGKTGAAVVQDRNLREQDFGDWEGKRIGELRKEFPGQVEAQEKKGWAFCPPNGERRSDVLERTLLSINRAAETQKRGKVLVVSHSSVMKALVYKLLDRSFLPGEPVVMKNYHLHELRWDGGLEITCLNRIELT